MGDMGEVWATYHSRMLPFPPPNIALRSLYQLNCCLLYFWFFVNQREIPTQNTSNHKYIHKYIHQ